VNLPPARWWIADSDAFYAPCAERLMRQPYALTADVGEAQDVVARRMAIHRPRGSVDRPLFSPHGRQPSPPTDCDVEGDRQPRRPRPTAATGPCDIDVRHCSRDPCAAWWVWS